eukprot:15464724-Alexandrium_andersonii.AAC.1
MDALREAPLVPLRRKQRDMIGPDRTAASVLAQLVARGLSGGTPLPPAPLPAFVPWQPDFYGDVTLSASHWATRACLDHLAAVASCGNHECRPEVCHKGRLGAVGFCRMMYWHWACKAKDGRFTWARRHGKKLISRWTPDSLSPPPIDMVPPNVGKVLTEQPHPFITRFNGAVYAAARCNHDVGVLLRCPVPCRRPSSLDAEEPTSAAAPPLASSQSRNGLPSEDSVPDGVAVAPASPAVDSNREDA